MEGASCPCAARIRAECFLMPAAAASQQLPSPSSCRALRAGSGLWVLLLSGSSSLSDGSAAVSPRAPWRWFH